MDNKDKILLYLAKHPSNKATMRDISLKTKIPYATFYRTLQQMQNLIEREQLGHSTLLTLHKKRILPSYLSVASYEEMEDYLKKQPLISKITSELASDDIVLLFGSYASGNQRKGSDIDLLVINRSGKKTMSFSKYELLFNIKINPIFISFREIREMLKDKDENVGRQALQNHILLNNPYLFWELVLHGI